MIILNCKICNKAFKRREYDIKRRPSLYCSRKCSNISRTKPRPPGKKWCSGCKDFLDNNAFSADERRYCRICYKKVNDGWARKNRQRYLDIRKNGHLKKHYGISLVEYNEILSAQHNVCAICGKPPIGKKLAVDHESETGRVRGLLCQECNIGIGKLQHKIIYLKCAIKYLENKSNWY